MQCRDERIKERLSNARRIWFFLDYDGTLAVFAPTPDQLVFDQELAGLLSGLAWEPDIRVAVVSGRRLDQICALLPVPGALLAGTYGIEVQDFNGDKIERLDFQAYRPVLESIKPQLEELIAGKEGFFLEDKGWSLALHARHAEEKAAQEILEAAQAILTAGYDPQTFRLLGGHRFLEVCPITGNKGDTVRFLLEQFPWPDSLIVYIGDDDKDEEAFEAVLQRGGIAIRVGREARASIAPCRLDHPHQVRQWLKSFIERERNPHNG